MLRFMLISMDRYIGEWLYYNFAAGSFHTKKLCSKLYSIEVEVYFSKTKNNAFGDTLFGT